MTSDREYREAPVQAPHQDPTALTTQQLMREIQHLRETVEAKEHAQEMALQVAQQAAQRAIEEVKFNTVTQIAALDGLTQAKFVTLRTLLDSGSEKVALALTSSEKAVSKAEVATEKRFESVNEFRAQLADQTRTFIPRAEFEQSVRSLAEKIDDLKKYRDQDLGKSTGATTMWGFVVGGITLAATVIAIILAFNN